MEAKLEKIENSEAFIEVEVDKERLEEGLQKAYLKVVKEISVPGFRKGKVPRQLLEARFGSEILYQDALEYVVPGAYEEAIKKLEIQPIAHPEFDIDEIEAGKILKFKAKVAVKPEVILGELEGLEVSIPSFTFSEEDLEKQLQDMQQRYAEIKEKNDEPAVFGDTVYHDFEGFTEGEPFPGGKGEDYALELGSNSFIVGYEEQMIGIKAGEEKDIKVTFPENYHAEELAGKEAVFKVKANKIEGKVVRELDDEFAQEVSEFETLEELRDSIRKDMEKTIQGRRKEALKQQALMKAVEKCEIPVAEAAVNMQLDNMIYEFEQRMAYQGLNLENYLQMTNNTIEGIRNTLRPDAEQKLKTDFMLEKLIEEKGFEATDEEINKQIEQIAGEMGVDVEKAQQNLAGMMENIRYGIKVDKAVDFIIDNAIITELGNAQNGDTDEDDNSRSEAVEEAE